MLAAVCRPTTNKVADASLYEEIILKSIFLTTAVLLSATAFAHAADVRVTGATAFADTLEEGEAITAIRVELPTNVAATDIDRDTFSVPGFDIIGTYVNDSGERDEADAQGNYVFIELARDTVPGNNTGKTLIYYDGMNERQDVAVSVRLNGPVDLADGDRLLPGVFTSNGLINVLADRFELVSFTDSNGYTVNYRLFVPEGYEQASDSNEDLPIVIFFHGAGEKGLNNDVQILGNPSALEYARDAAQARHPAFVMAPQSSSFETGEWAARTGTETDPSFAPSESMAAAIEALDDVIGNYDIDEDRVYGVGLSAGSRGVMISSVTHPDLYAAQLNIASADIYTDEQIQGVVDKPTWILLAEDETEERITNTTALADQYERLGAVVERRIGDDALNGFLRGDKADAQIMEQMEAADAAGANVMLTHLRAGTVLPSAHWSWMYGFNNAALQDWLFAQRRGAE
jgi:predicted peptidase